MAFDTKDLEPEHHRVDCFYVNNVEQVLQLLALWCCEL